MDSPANKQGAVIASLLVAASLSSLFFLLQPVFVYAQTPEQAQKLEKIEEKGLVPCGGTGQKACELCDIFQLAKNITDFIVYLGFFIATGAIGVGGFMIMIGGAAPSTLEQGKNAMTAGIVGLLIILFAWFIVDTSIKVLVGDVTIFDFTSTGASQFRGLENFGPWNSFKCEELGL